MGCAASVPVYNSDKIRNGTRPMTASSLNRPRTAYNPYSTKVHPSPENNSKQKDVRCFFYRKANAVVYLLQYCFNRIYKMAAHTFLMNSQKSLLK